MRSDFFAVRNGQWIAALLLALLSSGLQAREDQIDDLLSLSLDELLTIESVSKTLETLAAAPAVVTVYTRKDLDRLQPRNLAELLELTTGFLVERDIDGIGLGMRGIVTDNNQKFLIAIDGHRVSNNNNFGFDPFQKTRYVIDIAEQIEIIRGPGGVLWGPDAFLGLVNVITRKPQDGEELANRLELTWGPSDDTREASFSYLEQVGDARISFFASTVTSEGETSDTRLLGQGGFDPQGTFWERIESPSFAINGRVDWQKGWLAAQFMSFNHSVEGLLSPLGTGQREDFEQSFLEFGRRFEIGEDHRLSVRLYADNANASRRELADAGDNLFFEFPEERVGAELLFESDISERVSTIFGWDTRDYNYTGGDLGPGFTSPNGKSTGVGDLQTNGVFGQVTVRRGDFVLHLGGRYDTFSDRIDDLFAPRVSLAYQLREHLGIKLLYTAGALRPSWTQLTGFFTSPAASAILQEESSSTLELQFLWNLPGYDSSLSLYRTQTDDTINVLNGPEELGLGFYNYADYTTTGLEWQNTVSFNNHLAAFFNATYYFDVERDELVTVNGDGDNFFGFGNPTFVIPGTNQPYNIPDYFFGAGVTFSLQLAGHPLDMTAIVRHKGPRLIQGIEGQAADREVETTFVDLKARYRIGSFEFLVNGRNILDEDRIVGFGDGEAGFIIPKGATWELSIAKRF